MVAPNPLSAFGGGGQNALTAFGIQPPKKNKDGGNPIAPQPEPLPFMALERDKYNLPYYGSGFQGLARKVFAKIFDPSKLVAKPTEEQAKMIESAPGRADDEMKEGWDKWIGSWTGIKSEEMAQAALALNLATKGTDEEGNINKGIDLGETIKTATGIAYRGGGQVISTGLDVLSLVDKASRKVQAFNAALDDIGASSTILPDISQQSNIAVKVLGDTPIANRLGNLIEAWSDLNPVFIGYNLLRAATSGKSISQQFQTVKDYTRASNMIYTFYWEEAKKKEYFRRVQAGENPDLLIRELENPWVELAGSVLGDPTTYMGMGIIGKFGKAKTPFRMFGKTIVELPWTTVGRIPGFTDILGLKNIGRARLANARSVFTDIADPVTEKAFRALGEAADDTDAIKKIDFAVEAASKQVQNFATEYGIFSPDSTAKQNLMKKTVGTFFQTLKGRFRSPDDALETFKAFKQLKSGSPELKRKAFMHLKETFGTLPFSQAGMQSMEFVTKLIDDVDLTKMLAKHGGDLPAFADEALQSLNKVVDDMYPSVNDMLKASEEIKTLGPAASTRQKFLAKSYQDLAKTKPTVIWANKVNNAIAGNKLYNGLQGFYATVLMGMRPAYAFRNLLQNSTMIWHDLGARAGIEALTSGIETFAKSSAGRVLKQDWVTPVLKKQTDAIQKILGFVPTETVRGIGSAGREGVGFLAVGQDIEKVHSAIITRYVVESEMEKAIRNGGIPGIDALGLSPDMANSLMAHAVESFGDVKETLKRFRADQATGFFESWRQLELDPAFKDTLRRSDLLDEIDTIRKTAPDAATFAEQMDQFVKKVEDLAKRTADEPALVSADNPMSDVAVTVEKAFDEGAKKIMSQEELNQFRALNELRYQLQTKFREISQAMRGQLTGLLPMDTAKQFDQRFNDAFKVLDDGAAHWRRYADEVYNGVYAQSRKGAPPAQLWNQVRTVILDTDSTGKAVLKKISLADAYPNIDPTAITNKEFDGLMWRWFKENQGQFWSRYTQDNLLKQNGILEEMALAAGTKLDDVKLKYYGNLDNPQLKEIDTLTKQIQEWESYIDYSSFGKAGANVPAGTTLAKMDLTGVNYKGGKTRLFNKLNQQRAAQGLEPYATIDDVPFEEAADVLKKATRPMPPYVEGTTPTVTRQLAVNLDGGLRKAIEDFKTGTIQKWGQKVPIDTRLTDEAEAGLSKWADELDRRTASNRSATAAIANATRDFILHDYNKTQGDHFASFFTMYHYWPSRTYMRMMERVIDTPGAVAAYAKWRATAERVYADQPEFYRYNMKLQLPGMDSPYFFNLEATLNPIYSLTGVDFNDPRKRVDWMSSATDDMGKFGFNLAMPLQWAMAFNLMRKGEDEAARRWIGRAIPATQDLKAGLNLLKDKTGVDLMPDLGEFAPGAKYGDFDPFINLQGGLDAYEEKRVGRALSAMVASGELTPEAALDIMRNRSGAEFDEAVHRAINERAPGQMASYLFGVGFKTRTEGDMMVDEFYTKYYKLLAQRENISPDDYREQLGELMAPDGDYPFAATVLLSARGGDDRDAAYAYNVLGRIPPGDSFTVLQELGLDEAVITKFYESKGDFSEWTPQDRDRFMAAMLDLGATLALPDGATQQEWNEVKSTYQQMRDTVAQEFGEDIWDKLTVYYDLQDTNKDEAAAFKANHPEIMAALQFKREQVINNPGLYKYYGSFDTIEAYYDGKMRSFLADKYGADIVDKQTEYYNLKSADPSQARAFLNSHPELRRYWSEKRKLQEPYNRAMVDFAADLPQADPAQLRSDFEAANSTQANLAQFTQQPQVSWEEMSGWMSIGLQEKLQAYWLEQNSGALTTGANAELEYLARKNGYYDSQALLREAGLALVQGTPQQQGPNPLAAFGVQP